MGEEEDEDVAYRKSLKSVFQAKDDSLLGDIRIFLKDPNAQWRKDGVLTGVKHKRGKLWLRWRTSRLYNWFRRRRWKRRIYRALCNKIERLRHG